jgi:hypothetical protein
VQRGVRRPPPLSLVDLCAFALGIVLLAVHAVWLSRASASMEGDESTLVGMQVCARAAIEGGDLGALWSCPPSTPYPPLVPLSAALLSLPFENSMRVLNLSLLPWEALLLGAAWLGLRRHGGPWAGLAAVGVAAGMVTPRSVWGHFYTELPMMAVALWGAVLWDRSAGLTRRVPSLLLGLCMGLGLLIKWSFGFFWAAPMGLALGFALARAAVRPGIGALVGAAALVGTIGVGRWALGRAELTLPVLALALVAGLLLLDRLAALRWPGPRRPGLIGAPALAALGAALAAGPWYVHERRIVAEFFRRNLQGEFAGDSLGLAQTLAFYPAALVNCLGGVSLGLVGLGLARAAAAPRSLPARAALAFGCGFIALMASPYRADRYLVAGFGLLVPIIVGALPWGSRAAPALGLGLGLAALVGQGAWLAEGSHAAGWLRWGQGGQERIIFGNTAEDVAQAIQIVRTAGPRRYTLLPPPQDAVAPLRMALDVVGELRPAGERWWVVIEDHSRPRCVGCLRGELELRGAAPWSELMDGRGAPEVGPRALERRPRGTPLALIQLATTRHSAQMADLGRRAEAWTAAGLERVSGRVVADPVLGDVQVEVWMAPAGPDDGPGDPR